MKQPSISVIVPARNAEATLDACIRSILKQTFTDFELILVDNGSDDATKEIIRSFKKDGRVIYVFEEYPGRGAARNAGMRRARGEIVVMMDADCVAPDGWLERMTAPIRQDKEDACMGGEYDLTGNFWARNIQNADSALYDSLAAGGYISRIDTKNFAIRAPILKGAMFDSELKTADDLDLFLRLKDRVKVRYLPQSKVGHRHRSSFIGVVRMVSERGYWTTRLYKKYRGTAIAGDPVFESISFLNFLKFPFWMVLQFFKRPPGEAFFTLISELSWRAGIIRGLISS